uniref:Uncharacterized protein n=1 Tax=Anguilla anguilla TaxID=7936 RepID=A0A0E9W0R7_ANGAN
MCGLNKDVLLEQFRLNGRTVKYCYCNCKVLLL